MSAEDRTLWHTGVADGGTRAPKASEQIANRLRGRIVRGEIRPGEMLPSEKALMVEFQVSRPTLREAFRVLESDGLISVLPGSRGGPRAEFPDLSVAARHIGLYLQMRGTTLADLLEARIEFEPICARLLARRCTDEGLTALRAAVDRQRQAIGDGLDTERDFRMWVGAVGEFHDLIADHCGNNTLAVQARALRGVFEAHRELGIRQRRDHFDRSSVSEFAANVTAACQQLADLVQARAGKRAEEHWRGHLVYVTENILRTRDGSATVSLFD
ncbi:FadR/GntR family transcriptional regulator [Nocardia arizonensis]|uniref:FadR/GntR family transcriptional regulator n=1 Tax=Nocardia arizonensis TaxID=1141647 RepID=UPI0006D08757|nr:GntR family transcriptional regulator [Nocardia arizonensis]